MTLYLVLERGADPGDGAKLHKRFVRRSYEWLEPPRPNRRRTVAHVLRARNATEHERAVEEWARDVWAAWEAHHATVRSWVDRALG